MPVGAIAGAAGVVSNIVGGIAGREAGRADAGEARNAMNIAFAELDKLGLPPDLAKKIIFEQFQQQGLLTPELEQDILVGPSKVGAIEEAPELRESQMEALQILQQRGKTGLSPEDRAALNKVRQEVATDTEAKREQILQNFAARGQGGTGAELIAALQASQSGANVASEEGDRLAAMSSQRAMEAIQKAGQLGGDIRGQEFDINRQKAAADDAIEAFNIQNRLGVQTRNIGARNIAQERNLAEKQRMADTNTAMENAERLRQNQAERQKWIDEMARAELRSGARTTQAGQLSQSSAQASGQAAAPFQAIGAAAPAIGSYLQKDQKKFWQGGEVKEDSSYNEGGMIPGSAPMPGDHPANDTVPAMLSPGELIIPRSLAKTNFGKKLSKLLEDHHEIRKELDKNGDNK